MSDKVKVIRQTIVLLKFYERETTMSYLKKETKSAMYADVGDLAVNEIQREMAMDIMRQADTIANAIVWVVKAVRGLFNRTGGTGGRLQPNH